MLIEDLQLVEDTDICYYKPVSVVDIEKLDFGVVINWNYSLL